MSLTFKQTFILLYYVCVSVINILTLMLSGVHRRTNISETVNLGSLRPVQLETAEMFFYAVHTLRY